MKCYRSGGCGPYENRSCSECPASKPSYLEKNKKDNHLVKTPITIQPFMKTTKTENS